MGQGITPIFDTEVERVKEQLAQADALRKMGLEGNTGSGYHGGRVFVVGNPLGNIASGLAGAFLGDRARTRQGELEQQQTTARDEWLGQMPSGTDTQHYDPVANPGTGPLAEGMEVPQSPLQQAKAMQSWAMKAPRGMEGVQNFALQQSLTAPQREAEAAQKAQDRLHELQLKAIDARATQAERLEAQKEIARMQIEGRKETAQLVASLKASGGGKGAGEVDPAAADLIAARFIEGDKNALMGISRNAALHGAVMASIARQAKEQGVDAKELVMRGLEYGGASAEQRTVGNSGGERADGGERSEQDDRCLTGSVEEDPAHRVPVDERCWKHHPEAVWRSQRGSVQPVNRLPDQRLRPCHQPEGCCNRGRQETRP